MTLRAPPKIADGPLLAFSARRGGAKLAPLESRTRRTPSVRSLSLPYVNAWALSPAGSTLAVAVHAHPINEPNLVDFVSLPLLRTNWPRVRLAGDVSALAWTGKARVAALVGDLLCCPAELSVVLIDPRAGRILSRDRVPGTVLSVDRWPRGLVLLSSPSDGIGPATVVVVDARGMRQIQLAQRAGFESSAGGVSNHWIPGFASDASGAIAYVIDPSGAVAAVDLSTLQISYHVLTLEANAAQGNGSRTLSQSQKRAEGSIRMARWLGGGILALTGKDSRGTTEAAGLQLVNVHDWSLRVLDRGADSFAVADGLLLATGGRSHAPRAGIGLKAYGATGKQRLRLFAGRTVFVDVVLAHRAYVSGFGWDRVRVVDLKARPVITTISAAGLADPLLGRGSLPASFGYPGRSR
ncbi:MAG TPA: hypothetical protein VGQ84_04050 [Gaiellaceae bacterium]|nr:hypothetical protein [Gaiellaceae bacterium]